MVVMSWSMVVCGSMWYSDDYGTVAADIAINSAFDTHAIAICDWVPAAREIDKKHIHAVHARTPRSAWLRFRVETKLDVNYATHEPGSVFVIMSKSVMQNQRMQ